MGSQQHSNELIDTHRAVAFREDYRIPLLVISNIINIFNTNIHWK